MQIILELVGPSRFTKGLNEDIAKFCKKFSQKVIDDLETLLTDKESLNRETLI
ncbi:MAG: hypothetical protein CM1200mP13_08540 [Candidatus Pelagibacterales bacterium]|nr:MAG: hypothetical protein CM1200mP13_08540 [Pelagibacterales bacterium]